MKSILIPLACLPMLWPPPDARSAMGDEVTRAQDTYAAKISTSTSKLRAELLEALADEALEGAVKEQLELELEAFELQGRLPASQEPAVRRYERDRRKALDDLLDALERARTAFLAESRHREAESLEEETNRLREEAQELAYSSLRCRVDLKDASEPGVWQWAGSSLLGNGSARSVLRVRTPRSLTTAVDYRLRMDIQRVSGDGDLQVVFALPDESGVERGRGLLVLDGWGATLTGIELVNGEGAKDNGFGHSGPVLAPGESRRLELTVRGDRVKLVSGTEELFDLPIDEDLTLPDGIARACRSAGSFYLIDSVGGQIRIEELAFLQLEPTESSEPSAKLENPKEVSPDRLSLGSHWSGKNRNGGHNEFKVTRRNRAKKTATLRVRGVSGATYRHELETSEDGNRFRVTNIVFEKPAPGDPSGSVSASGGKGTVDSKGKLKYAWNFKIKRGGKSNKVGNSGTFDSR